jgi:predicted PurR-regulated permease PerM
METERGVDKLSRYIIMTVSIAVIAGICLYFSNVIAYILAAFVVSLIGRPITVFMGKIRIKDRAIPNWISTLTTMLLLTGVFAFLLTQIFPVVANVLKEISGANVENIARSLYTPLQEFNEYLVDLFPALGSGFRIEVVLIKELQKILDFSTFSNVIGSVAGGIVNFITNFAIAAFSVYFISFFFIRDNKLFSKIVAGIVPDKHEKTALDAIDTIEYLLSRYFVGLVIEMTGVALINFLGLWLIARLGVQTSIGIAFCTGLLNLIPYVGPLMGGVIGTVLGFTLKLCNPAIGLDVNIWIFTLILIAIFFFAQLIDNVVYQPVIYSSSIKSTPLEIFIVLLIAGNIGGFIGMLIAIPSYTVIRVVAGTFFRHVKFIRILIPIESIDKTE